MFYNQELILKYLKLLIIGIVLIFAVDSMVNGNLINNGKIYEYLFVDILSLCFIFVMSIIYESIFKKRYRQEFDLKTYFISSAVFILICVQLYKQKNILPEITHQEYIHAGIVIFFLAVGLFYIFKKNQDIQRKEQNILESSNDENINIIKITPSKKRTVEIFLGFDNGITVVFFDFVYRLIRSMLLL